MSCKDQNNVMDFTPIVTLKTFFQAKKQLF